MTVLLAVDGGGSKTDVAVVDGSGALLGRARGTGSVPSIVGVDRALAILDDLVGAALGAAGDPEVDSAGVYLSGLDLPSEVADFRAAVGDRHWARKALVDNDTFALMRAGTAEPQAVAVVCGTGINCTARHRDGRVLRFPAVGRISGDWGGGHELGELALWHAVRSADGRGPVTALQHAVPEALGAVDVQAVTEDLHFGRMVSAELNRLVPPLYALAEAGDDVAVGLLERQAEEIVALAGAALRRLDLIGESVPVVLGGALLARPGLLIGRVRALLAIAAPQAVPVVVADPPVLGAALLAAEAAGLRDGELVALAAALRPAVAAG